jgi:hypothetical protein
MKSAHSLYGGRVRVPGRCATGEAFADAPVQRCELAFENRSPGVPTALAIAVRVSGVCPDGSRLRNRSNEKGLWRGGRDSNVQLPP